MTRHLITFGHRAIAAATQELRPLISTPQELRHTAQGCEHRELPWAVNVTAISIPTGFRHFTLAMMICSVAVALADSASDDNDTDPNALDPSWLAAVKHPETGLLSKHIRPEETTAYFAILNHARKSPLEQLKAAANQFQRERFAAIKGDPNFRYYFRKPDSEFPTFVDLYRNPDTYHGKLVTFRGHLRRLISSPAGENAHGIQQLHEAWLYVDEAQQNPVVVVCTELPNGMPSGPDILVDFVSATGYFFKRYGYEDRGGNLRFAPLILAQRLEWTRPPASAQWVDPTTSFWTIICAALIVAIICWQRAQKRRTIDRRETQAADDHFGQIASGETASGTAPSANVPTDQPPD